MSHIFAKVNRKQYKLSKSANKQSGREVGDSLQTNGDYNMTNKLVGTFTGLILIALIGIVFCSVDVDAAQYSLTLTIDNPTPTVNVSPTTTGAFAKSDDVTISASTTNATGYTLSIKGTNNNYDQLINSNSSSNSGNSSYLSSISTALTEEQFKALDATSYNNMWGYLPSSYCTSDSSNDCNSNTSFLSAPDTNGDILDITTTANSTANTYTLALGARVDTDRAIGTYANTYIVTLVAEAVPYTITYIDNTIANFPTDVSDKTSATTVQISSNTPVRPGYTFLGWCASAPTVNISTGNDTCSNPSDGYQPGDSLTIDQEGGSNNFNLYAMWGNNYTIDALLASGTVYMQDFNTMSADKKGKIIASMVEGQRYSLKDNRDQETYYVAKLKDGNVWMLDNLRLGSTSTMALTAANTNSNGNFTLPAGITSGFNSYTVAQINVAYKNDATTGWGNGSKKIGVYYNYCAVSAGVYCHASNAGVDIPNTLQDAQYDVCPAGWRIPTGKIGGEYQNLCFVYGGSGCDTDISMSATDVNSLQYNLSLVTSGSFAGSQQSGMTVSRTWSSSYENATEMGRLAAVASAINPNTAMGRSLGLTARCLLK